VGPASAEDAGALRGAQAAGAARDERGRERMPEIEESVEIGASCQETFAYINDPEAQVVWQSNLVEYHQETEGDRGKGTRDRGLVRVAGKKISFTQEIVEHDPPHRIAIRSLEAPISYELEVRCEELATDRCRVTMHQSVGDMGGFFGRLGDAMVTKMYSRDVRGNLEHLRDLLEH
jgi:uncharacterized membrane protein